MWMLFDCSTRGQGFLLAWDAISTLFTPIPCDVSSRSFPRSGFYCTSSDRKQIAMLMRREDTPPAGKCLGQKL